tara:strand:+ start:114 stop:251 length:138 start_codon:yes stop_codon:yes gene_type:complete
MSFDNVLLEKRLKKLKKKIKKLKKRIIKTKWFFKGMNLRFKKYDY